MPHGYLITFFALASTLGGMVTPIFLAVLRLITKFKLRGALDGEIGGAGLRCLLAALESW